eukprot:scaffold13947_cov108-Isochrysis_galbana.AAC.4
MRKWVAHRRVYLNGTGAAGGSEGFMGWVAGTSVGVDVRGVGAGVVVKGRGAEGLGTGEGGLAGSGRSEVTDLAVAHS